MENIQNKDVKGAEGEVGHQCAFCHGSCGGHSMLCTGAWKGGWHGRHSIIRVAIGVAIIVAAFCAGTEVGEHGGHRGYDREGYGHDRFERHMMGVYERGQNADVDMNGGVQIPVQGMMQQAQPSQSKTGGMPMQMMMGTATPVK